jgi:2-amino-4-hydroxy-6-hydroxymethyldihydropteridine diphosphokinase
LVGPVLAASSLYETAAWGPIEQPAFLNQVLLVQTALPAPRVMRTLLAIEQSMGRQRLQAFGPRTIDLDILYFNQLELATPLLTVPHPRLANRRFTLVPLAEIAPCQLHPTLGLSSTQLLAACTDPLDVKKFSTAIEPGNAVLPSGL